MWFLKATLVFMLLDCTKYAICTDNRKFPPNFKIGVATSAYQIEGAWNEDGKGENIWDHLTHTSPNSISDKSTGDIACDSYHKTDTDVSLLKELGVDYYRLSLSWSRILPTGYAKDGVNDAGIEYYNNLLSKLKENGIEAMVTLYHWDLPEPLEEDFGGWLNETIVKVFADYARVAFEQFGDKVQYWATFNEPMLICEVGYEFGAMAPGKSDNPGIDNYQCAHNLLKSHAAAYHLYDDEFRSKQNGTIGMVINTDWFEPASDSDSDIEASERILQFSYGWYANPIVYGDYPQVMIDRIADRSAKEGFEKSRLPEFTSEEKDKLKGTFDFLGLNHYRTTIVSWEEDSEIGTPNWIADTSVSHISDNEIVPEGLRKITNWIKNTYNNPKIIVTENGLSVEVETLESLDDQPRVEYYRDYLSNLLQAIYDDNVNVVAYTAWSLMDNFEWISGYSVKYGLYQVNFTDPERTRTPKASARYYKSIVETRCLVSECAED